MLEGVVAEKEGGSELQKALQGSAVILSSEAVGLKLLIADSWFGATVTIIRARGTVPRSHLCQRAKYPADVISTTLACHPWHALVFRDSAPLLPWICCGGW